MVVGGRSTKFEKRYSLSHADTKWQTFIYFVHFVCLFVWVCVLWLSTISTYNTHAQCINAMPYTTTTTTTTGTQNNEKKNYTTLNIVIFIWTLYMRSIIGIVHINITFVCICIIYIYKFFKFIIAISTQTRTRRRPHGELWIYQPFSFLFSTQTLNIYTLHRMMMIEELFQLRCHWMNENPKKKKYIT